MMTSIQIMLGLIVGCLGFWLIGNSPLTGGSALLLSGFIIMAGVDGLCAVKKGQSR
jgi:hypothetical protein